jgi:hypothetical protein
MNAFWKSRLALWIVTAEIIVALLAGSAFACGGGSGGRSRSYATKKTHVHRVTPVVRVAPPAVPTRVPSIPVHPAVLTQPQAAPATAPAAPAKFPIELVDVRLIDIGNAAEGQGPRFRVVIKNVMPFPLDKPFEVLASAGISAEASPELPTGVQGVEKLGPGEIAPVEVRLPAESMAMAYPGREAPAPFSVLHVLIAGPKNALGSSSITKLASLPLGDVRLTDLVVAAPADGVAAVGMPLELQGEGFGPVVGQVELNVAGLKLNAEVLGWSELGIAVRMPELALTAPTPVQLVVKRVDGKAAQPLTLTAVLPVANASEATEEVPFPQGPESSDGIGGALDGFAPQHAAPATTETETTAAAEPVPQEPLSLAQVFGGLGLPPSDE